MIALILVVVIAAPVLLWQYATGALDPARLMPLSGRTPEPHELRRGDRTERFTYYLRALEEGPRAEPVQPAKPRLVK